MVARIVVFAACLLVVERAMADGGRDLILRPGMEGACGAWLVLGPLRVPDAVLRSDGGIPTWDPLGAAKASVPEAGAKAVGGIWAPQLSREARVRIDRKGAAVAYLAAIFRADRPRAMSMIVESEGGLELFVNGRKALARAEEGGGGPGADLVSIVLEAGDNLVSIRTWRAGRGKWSVSLALGDEQHRAPAGILVVLPGVDRTAEQVAAATASLRIERDVLLPEPKARIRYWLEFEGARPAGEVEVSLIAGGEKRAMIVGGGTDALAYELLGQDECAGATCPRDVTVRIGARALSGAVGLPTRDVERLAEAAMSFEEGRSHAGLPRTSVESVEWRISHLEELIEAGDPDREYLSREIRDTEALARIMARGEDPYAGRRGEAQRRGYRSSVDGRLHPYVLYVPPGWTEKGARRYGLVVALHGLNSHPMKTITSLFGVPLDENETKLDRERHPPPIGNAPMFAVAPDGFGNSGWAAYGERDVEEVIERVMERYRIAPESVYVTGASMGGIGAGALPLHRPDRFAAAAPLCGYHSLFEYDTMRRIALAPWERFLAEQRSNAYWARNGRHVPMYVVHGTRDGLRHSKSLVEAYRLNGYDVTFETPEAGHNVWDDTYAGRRIFAHFAKYRRAADPRRVSFVSARLRYRQSHWLRIDDVGDHAAWAKVEGERIDDGVKLETENVTALTILPSRQGAPRRVLVDGAEVIAGGGAGEIAMHREGAGWAAGPAPECRGLCKRPGLAGPIDDALYEPLLFVYGTADPDETAMARRVIGRLRVPKAGTTVRWPVEADVEISEDDIRDHSLVIVGTPRGNSLLARIADRLPIRAERGAVLAGERRFEGETVAAAFIHPNPLNPERYVVVHTGASARALFYATRLPQLLPDWVVYDAKGWDRAGGLVLDGREVLGAGFFDKEWKLPTGR